MWATRVINAIKLPTQGTIVGKPATEFKNSLTDTLSLGHNLAGIGETQREDGHKIWLSGKKKHQYGMTFIDEKEIAVSVIRCTSIFSRIISIRSLAEFQYGGFYKFIITV